MKHYILIAALLASGSAYANEVEETCGNMSELAEKMGELRYNGVPMREMMAKVEGDMAKAMVRDVYNLPGYASDEFQQRTVRNYSNEVYSACYKQFSGDAT